MYVKHFYKGVYAKCLLKCTLNTFIKVCTEIVPNLTPIKVFCKTKHVKVYGTHINALHLYEGVSDTLAGVF